HRHLWQQLPQRQNGLDAFSRRYDILCRSEPDGVTKQVPHGLARRITRRLARPVTREPGAVGAGHVAIEIGDRRNYRRPGLGRPFMLGSPVAVRMEAQRIGSVQIRNAASPQIRLCESARDRLRDAPEPACGLCRTRYRRSSTRRPRGCRFRMRKAEKAAGFIGDLGEVEETETFADYIEQITMLA